MNKKECMRLSIRRPSVRFFAVIWATVFLPFPLFADGFILPPVIIQHLPTMPEQRALIVHRDGMEKLLVESSFKGEGNDMAWIVPVPVQPTEIAKGSAGILNTLELALQPTVVDSMSPLFLVALLLFAWAVYLLASGRFVPLRSLLMALLLCQIVVMGMRVGMRDRATRGANDAQQVDGVKAGDVTAVGSYDVQILEADSSGRLEEWLAANDFHALPKAGLGIVDDYIGKGWKFVVARLRREGSGFSRPHPLAISFPAATPVYPMRLTQLAGSSLHLDLFVISDRQAAVDGMDTVYTDEFLKKDGDRHGYAISKNAYAISKKFQTIIGLPSFMEMVKERCVVTWLADDLENSRLAKDFEVRSVDSRPFRRTMYTQRGAILGAVESASLAGGILLVLGALWYSWRARGGARPAMVTLVMVVAVLGASGVGALRYPGLPQTKVSSTGYSIENKLTVDDIVGKLQEYPDILSRMSVEDVTQYFRDALEGHHNPYTGEPYAFEEQPGDIIIMQDAYGIAARAFSGSEYSTIGLPYDTRITGEEPSAAPTGNTLVEGRTP